MDYLVDQIPYIPETWKPIIKENTMNLVAWSDWFCGLRHPYEILHTHTSFFFCEYLAYVCGLITFIHAWRTGSRYWFTWIGLFLHGLNTECLSYAIPSFENFWHSQSSLMFIGRRLPAHVLFLYPIFDYTATIAAKRLKLGWFAEGCAVGLGAVLIDIPFDILGVKLLWWTWHDTDPNVADRMYHVPWTSYYFHAAFGAAFTWLLHWSRRIFVSPEYDWKLFGRELMCSIVAGLGAFWIGALQFIPLYHYLHDWHKVHTEICSCIFLGIYALAVWRAERRRNLPKFKPGQGWFDELSVMLLIYYGFFLTLVWIAQPESIVSTGLHEPIGKCAPVQPVHTISGMVLEKRQFLCTKDFDEPYYDFRCPGAGGAPPKPRTEDVPVQWYAVCGTRFVNHPEYITVVTAFCLLGLFVYFQWFSSGPLPTIPIVQKGKRKED